MKLTLAKDRFYKTEIGFGGLVQYAFAARKGLSLLHERYLQHCRAVARCG